MSERIPLSAAILAGGDSRRMGRDKAFLDLGGKTLLENILDKLLEIFTEVIVVTNTPEKLPHLPANIVTDIYKEGSKNALRGIHAGLTAASNPSCFVVACDMPFISLPLLRHMSQYAEEYDVVVPEADGHYQPLFACYHKSTLDQIAGALEKEQHRISDIYEGFHIKKISAGEVRSFDPQMLSFINLNTAAEYARAKELFTHANTCG